MAPVIEKNNFAGQWETFRKSREGKDPAWLLGLRDQSWAAFEKSGFPTRDMEDWRHTSLLPLQQTAWKNSSSPGLEEAGIKDAIRHWTGGSKAPRLVFVDGFFRKEWSSTEGLPAGVVMEGLEGALKTQGDWAKERLAGKPGKAFTALNGALLSDGAFLRVPKNILVKDSLTLLFFSTGRETPGVHTRILVEMGPGSQASLVEAWLPLGKGAYFSNNSTDIFLGDNAGLEHVKIQMEGMEGLHLASSRVAQEANSRYKSHYLSLGAAWSRNEILDVLEGPGAECVLNGLYAARWEQHMDQQTTVDHASPHGLSRQLYKGVLDGKATGVFNGKVIVRPGAQKTDSDQQNPNLLLSSEALVDTRPQLEILADDVKCTHGSAIGRLDPNALFYLRSRGLGPDEARSLLTYAFANDIFSRIKVPFIQSLLEPELLNWLS